MLLYIVIGIVSILLLALCFFLGYQYRKRNAERKLAPQNRRPPGSSTWQLEVRGEQKAGGSGGSQRGNS